MKIRYRPERSRKPWEVDLGYAREDGKRRRVFRYFSTKGEAEAELSARRAEVKERGSRVLVFSEEERERFALASRQLAEMGASIEDAVVFFRRHHGKLRDRVSVGELVRRGIEAKGRGRAAAGYVQALSETWRRFALGREERPAVEIVAADVGEWLASWGWAPKTQRNYLSDLSQLWRWACRAEVGLAVINPCEGVKVEMGSRVEEEISCLPVAWARELLEATRVHWPAGLWYPVLGLFAGIRSRERQNLRAEDVHISEGIVVVGASVAKGRSRGVVSLSAAGQAWMRLWEELGGKEFVFSADYWAKVRWECGWEWALKAERRPKEGKRARREWPRNVERHTFASMHYALHGDEARLKREMRHHVSEDTLFRHYRAVRALDGRVITKDVAGEFWGLLP